MPTNDIRSDIQSQLAFNAAISTDTTTNGYIIDTADFDLGIMFSFLATAYSAGTYTPVLEHGDDSGLSDAADIPDDLLIGTEAGAVLSAATALGAVAGTIGIVGTKRYVRVKIVSASTGTATVVVVASKKGEVLPVV